MVVVIGDGNPRPNFVRASIPVAAGIYCYGENVNGEYEMEQLHSPKIIDKVRGIIIY